MSTQLSMMTPVQLDLFDVPLPHHYEPPALSTPGVQAEHLERVTVRIGDVLLDFCRHRVGSQFHMDELRRYCAARRVLAPDSAGRVLRQLRQAGRVQYRVVSRRESLYEVVSVGDEREGA